MSKIKKITRVLEKEGKLFYKWSSKLGDKYMNNAIRRLLKENCHLSEDELMIKLELYFKLEYQLREHLSKTKDISIIEPYKKKQRDIFKN